MQPINMRYGSIAMLLYIWSGLRMRLLPSWVGWTASSWSPLSFPLCYLVLCAPLIMLIAPLFLGIGLL